MRHKLTKIVATVGPASESENTLREMFLAGMNVVRLNFKHGEYDWFTRVIDSVRRIEKKVGEPIAILQDLQGPDIRTGKHLGGHAVELKPGHKFFLTSKKILGDHNGVSVSLTQLQKHIHEGDKILIDDGAIQLMAYRIEPDMAHCEVILGGKLGQRKGINIPGHRPHIKSLNPKDITDVEFALKHGIEFIALSFVQSASDVLALRRLLKKSSSPDAASVKIISKIESLAGLENFDEILEASDGIMVARGDMGIELPLEMVPMVQKQLILKCNQHGKIVITATQMLDSMENNPLPTRAEANDVANAILDNTDAVMLSGEAASGNYPVEAVLTMSKIIKHTESQIKTGLVHRHTGYEKAQENTPAAIADAACHLAMTVDAKVILATTTSGQTPRLISRSRPEVPIVAISTDPRIIRQLMLVNHVLPLFIKPSKSNGLETTLQQAVEILKKQKYLIKGDTIVVASGLHGCSSPGGTDLILARQVN